MKIISFLIGFASFPFLIFLIMCFNAIMSHRDALKQGKKIKIPEDFSKFPILILLAFPLFHLVFQTPVFAWSSYANLETTSNCIQTTFENTDTVIEIFRSYPLSSVGTDNGYPVWFSTNYIQMGGDSGGCGGWNTCSVSNITSGDTISVRYDSSSQNFEALVNGTVKCTRSKCESSPISGTYAGVLSNYDDLSISNLSVCGGVTPTETPTPTPTEIPTPTITPTPSQVQYRHEWCSSPKNVDSYEGFEFNGINFPNFSGDYLICPAGEECSIQMSAFNGFGIDDISSVPGMYLGVGTGGANSSNIRFYYNSDHSFTAGVDIRWWANHTFVEDDYFQPLNPSWHFYPSASQEGLKFDMARSSIIGSNDTISDYGWWGARFRSSDIDLLNDPTPEALTYLLTINNSFGSSDIKISSPQICYLGYSYNSWDADSTSVCVKLENFSLTNLNIGEWLQYYWCLFTSFINNLWETVKKAIVDIVVYLFVPKSSTFGQLMSDSFSSTVLSKVPFCYANQFFNHDWTPDTSGVSSLGVIKFDIEETEVTMINQNGWQKIADMALEFRPFLNVVIIGWFVIYMLRLFVSW